MDKFTLAWITLLLGISQTIALDLNDPCTNPNGKAGLCIGLRQCKELSDIFSKKIISPDESAYVQRSQCGSNAEGKPLLCCAGATISPRAATTLPRPNDCGLDLSQRVFGGQPTDLDEFPWMALINYRKTNGKTGFSCGGSLINTRYVLTAAHCIQAVPKTWEVIGVRLGEHDLSNDGKDCTKDGFCADVPIDMGIEKIIVHEQYNPDAKAQWNDIALIRMDNDVVTSNFIYPICLPLEKNIQNLNHIGTKNWAAGWGRTEEQVPSDVKLKVELEVTDWARCASLYRRAQAVLRDTQMCAGGKKAKDTCSGDSGGPLMRRIISTYYLFGIVSFGPSKCGTPDAPGVYTDVSKYIDWIEGKIE